MMVTLSPPPKCFLYACVFSLSLFLSLGKSLAMERSRLGETHQVDHFHTLELSSLLPSDSCSPSTKDFGKRSTLKVVHKHGPCSYLNQEKSTAPTPMEVLHHDQSRVKSIHKTISSSRSTSISTKNDVPLTHAATVPAMSGLSLGTGNYIVQMGLGTPARQLTLIFYGLDFTGISVGGKKLAIPQSVFTSAGAIIDSGTVITRLPPAAYSALRAAFRQGMSKYPSAPALSILDTCYDLSAYTSVVIPTITASFNGGVNVNIATNGILYVNSSPSQVCLASPRIATPPTSPYSVTSSRRPWKLYTTSLNSAWGSPPAVAVSYQMIYFRQAIDG